MSMLSVGTTWSVSCRMLSAPTLFARVSACVPAAVKVRWYHTSGNWVSHTVLSIVAWLLYSTHRW